MDLNRKREYCQILGVSIDASEATMKRAYHQLARDLHPDRPHNKGKKDVEHQFQKVANAYEHLCSENYTLNNLKKNFKSRDIHSSLEHFFFTTKSHGSSLNNLSFSSRSCSDLPSLSTLSTDKLKTPLKGQTLQTTLRVTFHEAVVGCTKILEYSRTIHCTLCSGNGAVSIPLSTVCRDCGGSGVITANISFAKVSTACSSCAKEREAKRVCSQCCGSGKTSSTKKCRVEVPPGASSGMTQIFTEEGDAGSDGGNYGDFIVCFQVQEHPDFKREGNDVLFKLPVPFPSLVLGASIPIPTIYGKHVDIEIPPGSQHLDQITIKNEGFINPTENSSKGDMRVELTVVVPKILQPSEKKFLQQLADLPSFKPLHFSFK